MDWKKLGLCAALAGSSLVTVACGDGGGTTQDPVTRRYVVSVIEIPEATGTMAVGFNLDGEESTGDCSPTPCEPTCVDLTPDYTSINDPGETGVDNGLAQLVPQLGSLLGDSCPAGTMDAECLSALLAQQIAEGNLLLVMEVRDINSFASDDSVQLQLYLGTVPGCVDTDPTTCVPQLDGSVLAPGQAFDVMAVGSVVNGSIEGGRMTASTDVLTIQIETSDLSLPLNLRNAEVRANITDTQLSNGAIGGSLNVEELATAAEGFMAGAGDLVRNVVGGIADMEPDAADPSMCAALSAGLRFSAVDVEEPAAD